jgi:ribose transport system substrate-binding protein
LQPERLDNGGQPQRAERILAKYLSQNPRRKMLIATLDDPTALSAKSGIEVSGRLSDCIIVSHGLDRSVHGGASERKEIDPSNRASIILGSVAYFLDRYGYEVLPLALRMLNGETIPARTTTRHVLVTAKTVFREYPPTDMN